MADNFKFDLVSPERLLMSEPAAQVVVPGTEGQFTVMAGHAPVMTTLRPGVLDATLGSGKRARIFVRGGFADVNAAGLTVLAEQAIPLQELQAETINGLYKTEVIYRRGPWRSIDAVEYATLVWVDWFNNRRLLGSIGNVPPVEFEETYYAVRKRPATEVGLN